MCCLGGKISEKDRKNKFSFTIIWSFLKFFLILQVSRKIPLERYLKNNEFIFIKILSKQ